MNNPVFTTAVFLVAITIAVSLLWVARDAAQRGRSPVWIALLCLATWPLGFLLWRGLRPPPPLSRN